MTDPKAIPEHIRRLSLLATHIFVESGLHGIDAEVVLALDVSRPMAPLYISGMLRELVENLFALSLCFDDDGVVPGWAFSDDADPLAPLTRENIAGWMDREITSHPGRFRTDCSYAPVLEAICRKYFPQEWALPEVERKVGGALKRTVREYPSLIDQRPFPIFVMVVTGGDCNDPTETLRVIQRASHLPIFFQFAGISPPGIPAPEFAFLRRLDRLPDRYVDNCGFFEPRDFREPRQLFVGLLNEFPSYLEHERVVAMLLPPDEDPPMPLESRALERELAEPPEAELARREAERLARLARRRERAALEPPPIPDVPSVPSARRAQPMTRPYGAEAAAKRSAELPEDARSHGPRAQAPHDLAAEGRRPAVGMTPDRATSVDAPVATSRAPRPQLGPSPDADRTEVRRAARSERSGPPTEPPPIPPPKPPARHAPRDTEERRDPGRNSAATPPREVAPQRRATSPSPHREPSSGTPPRRDAAPETTPPRQEPSPGTTPPRRELSPGTPPPRRDAPQGTPPRHDAAPTTSAPRRDAAPGTLAPRRDAALGTSATRRDAAPGTPSPRHDIAPGTPPPRHDIAPGTPPPRHD
ncbi:MAG: VWA domain-containing protein, partial [Myxococcales bacterium]|nr:VWA domain-containing protein [Myxococcales bacterium]